MTAPKDTSSQPADDRQFILGDEVHYTVRLDRGQQYPNRKAWKRVPLKTARVGVLVGLRTVSNGIREWESDETGYIYTPTEYMRVALVAYSLHRKPDMVPLDSMVCTLQARLAELAEQRQQALATQLVNSGKALQPDRNPDSRIDSIYVTVPV